MSKVRRKLALVFFICSLNFSMQGCFWKKFGNSEKYNVMGAVTHQKGAYSPVEVGSIRLSSEEIVNRQNFSGTKTTFLWGLFSFTDY